MKTEFNDYGNPQVANLPSHLRQFIVDQTTVIIPLLIRPSGAML